MRAHDRSGQRLLQALASLLSTLGHPALTIPYGVAIGAARRGAPDHVIHRALALTIGLAVLVMLYSVIQVRRGRWQHVDASQTSERQSLNLALLVLTAGAALWLKLQHQHPALIAGLGLSAAIVATGLMLQRWLKLSLHVAFGWLAVGLSWPPGQPSASASTLMPAGLLPLPDWPTGVLLVGLGALAWSRLYLKRHQVRDVVAATVVGLLAAILFNVWV